MEQKPKKMIVFGSCLDCPIIKKCKEWNGLKKETRFKLLLGVGVEVGILKTCKLDDFTER